MKEIVGNLWDHWMEDNTVVCITTNGLVKDNGENVMGKGCAKEATYVVQDLQKIVGGLISRNGNKVQFVLDEGRRLLLIFPVKHRWFEQADLDLIKKSAAQLDRLALAMPHLTFVLPRPGCGNGRRKWSEVQPILMELPDNVLVINRP